MVFYENFPKIFYNRVNFNEKKVISLFYQKNL